MERKSAGPASAQAPEVAQKEAFRLHINRQGARALLFVLLAERAGSLKKALVLFGGRKVFQVESLDLFRANHVFPSL
jgi:hypothetical protein